MPSLIQALIQFLLGFVGMNISKVEKSKLDQEEKELNDALSKSINSKDTTDLDNFTR